ncbi:hypothetical protein D1AOALGA4SA_2414 [Olavius algarvensis Delta 1 endosymbiont]|nr:hypothetical protein D1AOALGA4SA_2414 [Olavius algarvensis Delta 1 endosymbiont]
MKIYDFALWDLTGIYNKNDVVRSSSQPLNPEPLNLEPINLNF